MFGRFFLIFLSTASLIWIVYAGMLLLDEKNVINPQTVFTLEDGQILIMNRTQEIQFDELNFHPQTSVETFAKHLSKHVFAQERIFVSEKRPILLVEIPQSWTESLVKSYFQTKEMHYSKVGEKLKLDNGFYIVFKNNYLLLSKSEVSLGQSDSKWPTWDTKASACMVQLQNPLKSTNVYFRENGTISFQTRYNDFELTAKVNDIELFAQFLSDHAEKYHFFEKEYALKSGELEESSPMYQWMEGGFVLFSVDGEACLMSDYNKSVDPYQLLLSDERSENSQLSNHFSGIRLCKSFPKDQEEGFYIGRVGDKVLLTERKETLERLNADYQLGNTLALNEEKFNLFFEEMPKKVSERQCDETAKLTTLAYQNLLIKTLKRSEGLGEEEGESERTNASFKFADQVAYVLGNGRTVYVIGENNEILALNNKKQLWKLRLDGQIVGKAKLIDMFDNGNQQILVSTNRKLYLINAANGENVNEFPVDVSNQNTPTFYRWNTRTYFLTVAANGDLLKIGDDGRIVKRAKLKAQSVKDEVCVYKDGNQVLAGLCGNSMTFVDVEKLKNQRVRFQLSLNFELFKGEAGTAFAYNSEQGAFISTPSGARKTVSSEKATQVKTIQIGKNGHVLTVNGRLISVYASDLTNVYQFSAPFNDVADADVVVLPTGKAYFAVLDEIEHNIQLVDSNGLPVYEDLYEGSEFVKLSTFRNKLVLTTKVGSSLVQHYIELK